MLFRQPGTPNHNQTEKGCGGLCLKLHCTKPEECTDFAQNSGKGLVNKKKISEICAN